MAPDTPSQSDLNATTAWEEGKRIASLIGLAPNTIATCIRALRKDVVENAGHLSPVSDYCVSILLRGQNIRAALYFAAKRYRPERVPPFPTLPPRSFLEIFSLDELSYLIGILFAFRRIKAGCSAEPFLAYSRQLHLLADIGALVGSAIPKIGLGRGLLMGSLRHLACAMFLGIDEKGFAKHRRVVRIENTLFNSEAEFATWGTTHAHIGSYVVQLLGLGVEEASVFSRAVVPALDPASVGTPDLYTARIALTWIEAFYSTGLPPSIIHRGEYYPLAQELEKIQRDIREISPPGTPSQWLTKNRSDLPTPMIEWLAEEGQPSLRPSAPPELSSELSKEFEQLVDEEG